jgi:hypothetical protein
MIDQKTYERFAANVFPEPNSGCWLWTGGYFHSGYGRFNYGRQIGAHVFSYIAHHGDLPFGKVVHHVCNNKACVNPQHLEAVTHSENCRAFFHDRRSGRVAGRVTAIGNLEPAFSIVRKFDTPAKSGTKVLAERLGIDRSAVAKWVLPKASRGTGGWVPYWYYDQIMAFAKEIGIDLDPAEFVIRPEVAA